MTTSQPGGARGNTLAAVALGVAAVGVVLYSVLPAPLPVAGIVVGILGSALGALGMVRGLRLGVGGMGLSVGAVVVGLIPLIYVVVTTVLLAVRG